MKRLILTGGMLLAALMIMLYTTHGYGTKHATQSRTRNAFDGPILAALNGQIPLQDFERIVQKYKSSPLLIPPDILDVQTLVENLSKSTNGLLACVRDDYDHESLAEARNWDINTPPGPIQCHVTTALNKMITGPLIFGARVVSISGTRDETRLACAHASNSVAISHANRLFIEDAFPDAIARLPRKFSNELAVAVRLHRTNEAKILILHGADVIAAARHLKDAGHESAANLLLKIEMDVPKNSGTGTPRGALQATNEENR